MPGGGLDFWALGKGPHVYVSQARSEHWTNDIDANGCTEFRKTLNLGLVVGGGVGGSRLVSYFCYSK